MNKVCKFLSVLLCVFAVSYSYADDGAAGRCLLSSALCTDMRSAMSSRSCDE